MDYRFPQASSSRSEQPSTSRASGSIMPFPGSNPRTSSKRSFDEYGHLESRSTSGPSGNSSTMTTPTSSAVGAPAMLGLGNTSSIGNPFGDPVNNAHNTRNKRRRGSLSPPQADGSLHVPSMPVGTSLSTSASDQRARGHSASNSAESLMSWMDDTASQETLQQSIGQMNTQVTETSSVLNGGQNQPSRNLNNGDSLCESRPDGEFRDNRMSWMPDNGQATDTVTTNTEPGWNFAPHNQNPGPTMEFTMPHAQGADALNQPPLQFLERNSFESNNESNGPQMPTPSFRQDIRSPTSDFDNHTSPNLISPRSPPSLYMDSWYRSHRSHDSRPSHPIVPPSPIESPPSPPAWRDPPPPSQSQSQPTQPSPAESSSWWPFNRWGFDGAISPPPPAPQVTPRSTQETRSNATSGRPSTMHSSPMFVAENRPDYRSGPAQSLRPNFTRAWDSSRAEAPPSWPPYLISGSSETTPPRQLMFPEPQSQGAGRNNGYTSYPRDDHSMHRSGPRVFNETSPAVGPSSSSFSTFGNPSGIAGPRPRDPHALPMPSDMSSSRHSVSLYPSASDRSMRSHEEPARSRTSGRAPSPSPTPARQTIRALHDIWDRDTRNRNSGMDFDDWRPYSSRSNSDSSPVDPYNPYSPIDPQQRRADRLEHWRDEINSGPGDRGDPFQRFDRFGMERSTGPSGARPRNTRPEPRNRPFYDHPSMGDLISRHSNHPQERERRELHSSMASLARTPGPPPTTRRPPPGFSDYTRGGNAGSSAAAPTGRPIPPPSPTRAPPRSNSPVSSRPFPPLPSSRRPPSPASRPSPFFLDTFSHSSANEPSERPSESRSASLRTTRQRRRERESSRMGRLLGSEHPLAFLGSDEDFPYYDSFNVNLDDPEISGLSITTAERIRALSRFRAGRRALGALPTGRMRALGDYVMDDDWDGSYETLIALSQNAVKRGCSEGTLDGLPHGTYSEFATGGSEENKVLGDNGNCAICLEDYVPADSCIKLPRCMHFYHKDCVKEWLKTAKTCPVCRENVEGAPRVTGNSRSTRVRFGPISDMHREPQNPAVEYLRQTSGAGPATVPTPRPPRRRSTNEGRPIPPPPSMFQDVERETRSSTLERMRRIRMADALLEGPLLSEFEEPWPTFSPPSPPSHPFSLYRRSPSPPFMDATGTSTRFARGAALARAFSEARAFGEGSVDDMMRASNYN